MKRYIFLAVIVLASNTSVFGWGQTGHRVIGHIAENHLSKKAKKEIEKILGNESLAFASTWMDEIRSRNDYNHTHDWHWVTILEGETYESSEKNPNGDVIEGIARLKKVLQNEEVSLEKKREALRFIVHMVGDLHQPLHVGSKEDRGGNAVKVKWFGQDSNLHKVWDSGIIDSKDFSYTELAKELDHVSKDQVEKWQSTAVVDWAHEAQTYHGQVYNMGNSENLGYYYMDQNWDLVQQQLVKAGVRLAGVLNEAFD